MWPAFRLDGSGPVTVMAVATDFHRDFPGHTSLDCRGYSTTESGGCQGSLDFFVLIHYNVAVAPGKIRRLCSIYREDAHD